MVENAVCPTCVSWTPDEGCTCKEAQIEDGECTGRITKFEFRKGEDE